MKKLSIITICLNEKNNIEKTIKSVVNQNFTDFEYIIIDGGSTDGTVDIIKKYQDKISYFVSEKDKGIYNAMNKGIEHSDGEYLLFLNGGDYLFNESVIKNIFDNDFKDDIIFGDYILEGSNIIKSFKNLNINSKYLFYNYIPHPSSFIKKKLFINYGFYDENYKIAGDYDFFLRVIERNKATVRYFSEIITAFNNNGISSNPSYFNLQRNERRRAQIKYFSFAFLFVMLLLKIKRMIFKKI